MPPNGNYRETIVGTGGAGTSITLHYQRGADARFTVTRGPIRTSYGTYRGADWHQDANGITVTDAPDPERSPSEAPAPSAGTTITTYAAYARFGTQTLPSSWRIDDRRAHEVTTYRRTQFVTGATSDADVAKPAARQLVSWPAGVRGVDLHAVFEDGQISIPVRIAGRSFFFLLDSGASAITIDPSVARELGLTLVNERDAVAGKRFESHDTVIPELNVAGLRMHDVVATRCP